MAQELLTLLQAAKSLSDTATDAQYVQALNQHSRLIDQHTGLLNQDLTRDTRQTELIAEHHGKIAGLQAQIDANLTLTHHAFILSVALVVIVTLVTAWCIGRVERRLKRIESRMVRTPTPEWTDSDA
jgi:hypothetical protein